MVLQTVESVLHMIDHHNDDTDQWLIGCISFILQVLLQTMLGGLRLIDIPYLRE